MSNDMNEPIAEDRQRNNECLAHRALFAHAYIFMGFLIKIQPSDTVPLILPGNSFMRFIHCSVPQCLLPPYNIPWPQCDSRP